MKRIRFSFCALLAVLFFSMPLDAHAGEMDDKATTFVQDLEKEAVSSLTDTSKPRQERVDSFRTLFRDKFAVDVIGRWTLGRSWRKASKEEQTEFLELFEDLMVATYVDRFANYAGEGLKYTKTVPVDENMSTVHTEVVRPDQADARPISVLWRVGRQGELYKVLDVVVQGASMSLTLQKEFTAIVRNKGSVAGLLEELRKKTAELNQT
jgi:phospholipid transport system substrate-binding protein